jgi:transcriptional regulator with XRE-family HTH domain
MAFDIIIPAQIRAARSLLNWSQEQLATEAGVGLSSVRDIEGERRALDTGAAREIRRALENGGVVLIPGDADGGPGLRFVADRPHVVRPPTTMSAWDGMPFVVEWRGRAITVFVAREVLDDLGHFRSQVDDAAYLAVFEKHRGGLLDDVARALAAGEADARDRLRLTGEDVAALA